MLTSFDLRLAFNRARLAFNRARRMSKQARLCRIAIPPDRYRVYYWFHNFGIRIVK